MMRVMINGMARDLADGSTVDAVVRTLTAPRPGVAVARNGEVVPRTDWDRTHLVDGDRIEILAATAGG